MSNSYGIYVGNTKESIQASKDAILEVIFAVNETKFGDEVAIKALDCLTSSLDVSGTTISGCHITQPPSMLHITDPYPGFGPSDLG